MELSMKKYFLLLPLLLIIFSQESFNQTSQWRYVSELKFPAPDSGFATPYLCAVDSRGRVWVVTSKTTNILSHNAIYYADSTDTILKKFIDFDLNGDSDTLTGNIGAIRGITCFGRDVIIVSSAPYPRTKPSTLSCLYYYKNGDTTLVEKYGNSFLGLPGAGYGTFINGATMTRDTILFSGNVAGATGPGPKVRSYNFKYGVYPSGSTPARGSWGSETNIEIGGSHNAGIDVIRDVAVIPNGDYSIPETPFYSSRNSVSTTNVTGGIAIWTGGSQYALGNYSSTRVQALNNELDFGPSIPYGITVDKNGYLWVAGVDSTRKWVKGYQVSINYAQPMFELPGKFSLSNPVTNGAPMNNPNDVALTPDGLTAYVTDANKVDYKFKYGPSEIGEKTLTLQDFSIEQNFPNPFNPTTTIAYILPEESLVKLVVTNSLGEIVSSLFEGREFAGKHVKTFTANNLPSGIYFYTIITNYGRLTKKMLFMK
jgi:hypothetical protein